MSAPDIFLSYNREDQTRAKLFAEAFAAAGFDVCRYATLRSGESWSHADRDERFRISLFLL
jgi:hypothetical protein